MNYHTSAELKISSDKGETWQAVPVIGEVQVMPTCPGLYASTDEGRTWQPHSGFIRTSISGTWFWRVDKPRKRKRAQQVRRSLR